MLSRLIARLVQPNMSGRADLRDTRAHMNSAKLALGIAFAASCAARPGPATTPAVTSADPPATSTAATDTRVAPPTSTPTTPTPRATGSGAFCLIVGPTQIVVRCYWSLQSCDDQVAFNTQNGLTDASECRATPEPRCFQYKHGELCYPTSANCEKNRAAMSRYPDEQPSACAIKTAP